MKKRKKNTLAYFLFLFSFQFFFSFFFRFFTARELRALNLFLCAQVTQQVDIFHFSVTIISN